MMRLSVTEAMKKTATKHVHARQQHQLMKSYRCMIALDIGAIVMEALKYGKNYIRTYGHAHAHAHVHVQVRTQSISIKTVHEANGILYVNGTKIH